jgi:hypothetical protein
MTWELLRRGRWNIAVGMLVAIALPALILVSLNGALDPQDATLMRAYLMLTNLNVFVLGAVVLVSQDRLSRMYAFPLRTSTIVAWRLIPMMVVTFLEMVVCTTVLNLFFSSQWPVWSVAIFAAVAVAAVQAVAWLAEKSPGWLLIAVSVVGGVLGLWFSTRYGSLESPTHYWREVTPLEAITMLLIAAAAFFVSIKSVARNRRGEPPISVGFIAWLERVLDPTPNLNRRLKTAFDGQCWLEWRHKGWAMPAGALILLVAGFIGWLFGSRDPEDLLLGLLAGGAGLSVLGGIGGFIFGTVGQNDAYIMGHFLATRPISDTNLGWAILKTTAKSILLAWCVWAFTLGIVYSCLRISGSHALAELSGQADWWYIPATLLGMWAVAATIASLGLTGRTKLALQTFCVILGVVILEATFSKFLLSQPALLIANGILAAVLGGCLLIVAVWIFIAARRRGLIQPPVLWAAASIWIIATAAVCVVCVSGSSQTGWLSYLLVADVAALTVLPIASMPLAICFNRHR